MLARELNVAYYRAHRPPMGGGTEGLSMCLTGSSRGWADAKRWGNAASIDDAVADVSEERALRADGTGRHGRGVAFVINDDREARFPK
jgi:hypothetical protein